MFIKIISIISSLTLLSRVLGYLRDLLIAKVIGAGLVSDSFFIAFKLLIILLKRVYNPRLTPKQALIK